MFEPTEEEKIAELTAREADIRARMEHDRGSIPWANERDASSAMARIRACERDLRSIGVEKTHLQSILKMEAVADGVVRGIEDLERIRTAPTRGAPPSGTFATMTARIFEGPRKTPDLQTMEASLRAKALDELRLSHLLVQLAVPGLSTETTRGLGLSYKIPQILDTIDSLRSCLSTFARSGDPSDLTHRGWRRESYRDLMESLSFATRFHLRESRSPDDLASVGVRLDQILSGLSGPVTTEIAAWAEENLGEVHARLASSGQGVETHAWGDVVARMRLHGVRGVETLERALSFAGMTGPASAYLDLPTDGGPRR